MLRFVWEGLKIMSLLPIHRMERNPEIWWFQKSVGEEASLRLFVCVVIICQRRGRASGSWCHHCLSPPPTCFVHLGDLMKGIRYFFKKILFLDYVHACVYVWVCAYGYMCPGSRSDRSLWTWSYRPAIGAGN